MKAIPSFREKATECNKAALTSLAHLERVAKPQN